MERIRLAHPIRRSLVLALIFSVPMLCGALSLGAEPLTMFVGGMLLGIVGALLFGGVVRWLPPLAFALVMLPGSIAAAPVYGWPVALVLSIIIGLSALALFYRPTPPEPPRPRRSPYQPRDIAGRPVYGHDHGQTPATSSRRDGRQG